MDTASNMARITIQDELLPWLADACARFGYLHPNVDVKNEGAVVEVVGPGVNDPALVQDFLFCLYRQKIYGETLTHRRMLIEGVTGFASRTT